MSRIQRDDPEAYVRRVLVNTFASSYRRKWRGEIQTETLPDRLGPDLSGSADCRPALRQALMGLPARQRAVVVLHFHKDLSEVDTAALLGVAVGAVKSQTFKALASGAVRRVYGRGGRAFVLDRLPAAAYTVVLRCTGPAGAHVSIQATLHRRDGIVEGQEGEIVACTNGRRLAFDGMGRVGGERLVLVPRTTQGAAVQVGLTVFVTSQDARRLHLTPVP